MKQKMRKVKRWIAGMLACMLLPAGSLWGDIPAVRAADGIFGDYTYAELEDGTLEITGYTGTDTEITIPAEIDGKAVTSIGGGAFIGCMSLREINLPEEVMSIADRAFCYCVSLEKINLPEGITSIGNEVFDRCRSLEKITIPEGVTRIGQYAFLECHSLKEITIPEGVTRIDGNAFSYCSNLKEIVIPEGVTHIYGNAFSGCSSLESIVVRAENKKYDSRENCNAIIEEISARNLVMLRTGCCKTVIPDEVTTISSAAFLGCDTLKEIIIPDKVRTISDRAFQGCSSLKEITIPDSVTSIEEKALGYDLDGNLYPDFIICGNAGTAAEAYAKENGITFKNLADEEEPPIEDPSEKDPVEEDPSEKDPIETPDDKDSVEEDPSEKDPIEDPSEKDPVEEDPSEKDPIETPDDKDPVEEDPSEKDPIENPDDKKPVEEQPDESEDAYVVDVSDHTVVSKADFENILEENQEKDVVIKPNDEIHFIFGKGTMKVVEGNNTYDFGVFITKEFEKAVGLPLSITKDAFVRKIDFNYSGELPGTATIRIFVGKHLAGKTLYYSLLLPDGSLKLIASASVDAEGHVSVFQSHCSSYVLTSEEPKIIADNKEKITTNAEAGTRTIKENPKTGDAVSVLPYLLLLFVSAAGICAAVYAQKAKVE